MPMLPDRRRTRVLFVALAALGGALILVVSLTAWASTNGGSSSAQSVPRVGLMHVGTDHVPSSWPALKARLAQLGWKDGQNIQLIWRNLEPDAAPAQAKMFVSQHVDAIVAFEDTSIAAAQAATARSHVPIVFLHPSDPVRDGLVKSLSHPGTNLTGVYGARDEVDKQLEIYQLLVPELRRMLTLVDPTDKRTKRLLPGFQAAAAQLARPIQLDIREASSDQDLKRVFHSLKPGEVDGVFLLSPSLRLNHTALTIRLAKQARLPVQAHRKEWVEQGALFSYGIDLPLIGRTAARYVDSILKGTSPADLPVEEVPKLEFAINLKTAGRLGIKVPQNMIIRADEVYR
jgi:ABC-type uncharacterized transport system substrate-binding protein